MCRALELLLRCFNHKVQSQRRHASGAALDACGATRRLYAATGLGSNLSGEFKSPRTQCASTEKQHGGFALHQGFGRSDDGLFLRPLGRRRIRCVGNADGVAPGGIGGQYQCGNLPRRNARRLDGQRAVIGYCF